MKCWYCGAPADESAEVTAYGDPEAVYLYAWARRADDGHTCAAVPPTPRELLAAGDRAFQRVIEEWGK